MVKVAQEILSFCTKCRMDLSHTVVAMQGDRVVRVICKTCRGEHAYRAPKGVNDPALAPAKITRAARAEKQVISMAEEWESRMATHKNVPIKDYSFRTAYKAGERIEHPTFGTGFIEKVVHPNKIEVIFKTEIKLLIHTPS